MRLHERRPYDREPPTKRTFESDAETLVATKGGDGLGSREDLVEICSRIRCPVLVLHGDEDRIRPHAHGAELTELTGGRFVTLEGSGHCPHVRDPVKVNLLIRDFVESLERRSS